MEVFNDCVSDPSFCLMINMDSASLISCSKNLIASSSISFIPVLFRNLAKMTIALLNLFYSPSAIKDSRKINTILDLPRASCTVSS